MIKGDNIICLNWYTWKDSDLVNSCEFLYYYPKDKWSCSYSIGYRFTNDKQEFINKYREYKRKKKLKEIFNE